MTICADASPKTGYGHLYRSLLVGETCRKRHGLGLRALLADGHDAAPLIAAGIDHGQRPGTVSDRVLTFTGPDAGPLLLDSYSVSTADLSRLRQKGYRIVMFDDGNRLGTYDVDLLIDSAPGAEGFGYTSNGNTQFLLGPDYFPLRPEFTDTTSADTTHGEGGIVITFGGSDPDDATAHVFDAFASLEGIRQTYILGPGYRGRVSASNASPDQTVLHSPSRMADVLSGADIVVLGGGGTAMEAAALGKPMMIVILSPDQRNLAGSLEKTGAAILAGDMSEGAAIDKRLISELARNLMSDGGRRLEMSGRAKRIVDGKGAERIADAVAGLLH